MFFTHISPTILCAIVTIYMVRQVYTNPALRSQVENLYNYYTGQIPAGSNTTQESEEDQPMSESPQEILQNILSGNYREQQAQQQIDGGFEAVSGSGGAYI